MSLYTGQAWQLVTDAAQELLDQHVEALSGMCLGCGERECSVRRQATEAVVRRGALPKRRPGASRPEYINARRIVP